MMTLLSILKKLLFDDKCVICESKFDDNREYLCYNCFNKLKYSSSIKKLNNTYYIWDYNEIFKKAIFNYKFAGIAGISEIFTELLREKINYVIALEGIDCVIPVPVHKRRKNERGFNQSEQILKRCKIDFVKIERVKNTKAMYGILSENKRKSNIEASFKVDFSKINGKRILIFDDIITTGSTTQELEAEIRKEIKDAEIVVFSMAAASFYKKKNRMNV